MPRKILLALLLLVGVGFLAFAGWRAYNGPRHEPKGDLLDEINRDLESRKFAPLSEPLQKLLDDKTYEPVATQVHPSLGKDAPGFELDAVGGGKRSLSATLKDGPVVVVFYYGYHCNHCVSQLFALNKDIATFRELGATVVAISADPPELTEQRVRKFGAFAFPVLSDPDKGVAAKYDCYRVPRGATEGELYHGTFVVSRAGKVTWANVGEEPFTENRTLLKEIARAEGRK